MWAAGITSALLLNLYVPIYDATLLAVSGLITAGAVLRMPSPGLRPAFLSLSLLLYVGVLIATPLGRIAGIQLYTVLVGAFALFQVVAARAVSAISDRAEAAAAD
jgi:hypothetical protein